MQPNEIHALIQLLDDPDEHVYQHVREQLLAKGTAVLPALIESRESHAQCEEHERRMDELVDGLHGAYVHKGLRDWFDAGAERVLEGALWVHKAADPLLDMDALRAKYEVLKRNVWLELNEEFTALEQVRILNHIIYDIEGYTNAKSGQPDPKHALLGEVLAEQKGNPLGLGILYLSLAQDLNLPIHGVNLPNHFILCYCDEHHVHHETEASDHETPGGVLFYINPFSQGTVINKAEVSEFLSHLELPVDEKNCGPCGSVDIVRRLIGNVAYGYERNGFIRQAEKMRELLMFVETGATETSSADSAGEEGSDDERGAQH
jgi:hypothetical protein